MHYLNTIYHRILMKKLKGEGEVYAMGSIQVAGAREMKKEVLEYIGHGESISTFCRLRKGEEILSIHVLGEETVIQSFTTKDE